MRPGRPGGRPLAAVRRIVVRYRWVAAAVATATAILSQVPPPR